MGNQQSGISKQSDRTRHDQGRHTGCLRLCESEVAGRCGLVGVSGLDDMESRSARRINCMACNGDPGEEVLIVRGLVPLGVDKANEGMNGNCGSGVCGGSGGLCAFSDIAWARIAELIHFSSCAFLCGGDSVRGSTRNESAKCSLMNLDNIQYI